MKLLVLVCSVCLWCLVLLKWLVMMMYGVLFCDLIRWVVCRLFILGMVRFISIIFGCNDLECLMVFRLLLVLLIMFS